MLNILFHIFSTNYQLKYNFLAHDLCGKWVIKTKCCCWSRRIKVNTVLSQQKWWCNGLKLKAPSDMRKQEQRIKIVVKKISEPACRGLSNFWEIIHIPYSCFFMSGTSFQQQNHCLSIVATKKWGDLYLSTSATTISFYHSFSQRSWARDFEFYLANPFCHKCGRRDLA